MEIFSSIQNPFDLYSDKFSFSILDEEYINWKTQPIDDLCLPATVNNVQLFIDISDSDPTPVYELYDGSILVNSFVGVEIDTVENNGITYKIWGFSIDLSIYDGTFHFVLALDVGGLPSFLRSSDFKIAQLGVEMLKIEFTDSSESIKGGIFFKDGTKYQRYVSLLKYDNKIEPNEDDFATDYNGNRIDIEKTFSEIEYYAIPTMSKKQFMGLVEIAKNDTITVNGRSASLSFDVSEINTVECLNKELITGSLIVTYSDSDGFLNPKNLAGLYIAIDDDGAVFNDNDGAILVI